jgi:hypothetical protein
MLNLGFLFYYRIRKIRRYTACITASQHRKRLAWAGDVGLAGKLRRFRFGGKKEGAGAVSAVIHTMLMEFRCLPGTLLYGRRGASGCGECVGTGSTLRSVDCSERSAGASRTIFIFW